MPADTDGLSSYYIFFENQAEDQRVMEIYAKSDADALFIFEACKLASLAKLVSMARVTEIEVTPSLTASPSAMINQRLWLTYDTSGRSIVKCGLPAPRMTLFPAGKTILFADPILGAGVLCNLKGLAARNFIQGTLGKPRGDNG